MGAQDAERGAGRRRAGRGTERGGVEHLQGRVEGGLPRALPAKPQALSARVLLGGSDEGSQSSALLYVLFPLGLGIHCVCLSHAAP